MLLREVYGLPAERGEVQSLIGSSRDVGSDRFGIPMTQAEVDKVDPNGRDKFSDAVRRKVMPWLERQPEYAGSWLDQKNNGELVVVLTNPRPQVVKGIDERMPNGQRGWQLVQAEHSMAELEAAARDAFGVRGRASGGSALVFSAVDVENNRLILHFDTNRIESVRSAKPRWQAELGVPVKIRTGKPVRDTAVCTRGNNPPNNCWGPIPAGVRTRSFSVSGRECTMGFQIHKASAPKPNQWLTAGHCVHPYRSNGTLYGNKKVWHSRFFHGGDPMGKRKSTLYNTTDRMDIARVALDFSVERTDKLWRGRRGRGFDVGAHTGVMVDDVVFWVGVGSDGRSKATIKKAWTCWYSETWQYNHPNNKLRVCGAWVEGAMSRGGDSGAPVFTKKRVNGRIKFRPVGIVSGNKPDSGTMVFTRLTDAFDEWDGWEIRFTGCC